MTIPAVSSAETDAKAITDLVRACFETALGRPVCHRPGPIVELLASTTRDECCEGAAWVRVAGIYPGFPTADDQPSACLPDSWSLQVELGASRCAPTPDETEIPTCGQQTALAEALLDDYAAMLCALACFAAVDSDRRILVGAWEQAPIEGRCAGSTMLVTVSFTPCATCPE